VFVATRGTFAKVSQQVWKFSHLDINFIHFLRYDTRFKVVCCRTIKAPNTTIIPPNLCMLFNLQSTPEGLREPKWLFAF
jgi:hypothetical protein